MAKIRIPVTPKIVANALTGALLEPEYTFARFVNLRLLGDPQFGADMAAIFAGIEIKRKIETAAAGDLVELTMDQHERLARVAKAPTGGYEFMLMSQCPEYMLAIVKPEEA
jgi:hypothetical protein